MPEGPHRECDQAAAGNEQRDRSVRSELAHRTGELGGAIDRSMQHRSLSSDVYIFNYRIDAELHVKFVVVSRRQSLASDQYVFGWRQTAGSAEAICFEGAGNRVMREHPAARAMLLCGARRLGRRGCPQHERLARARHILHCVIRGCGEESRVGLRSVDVIEVVARISDHRVMSRA